MEKSRKNLLTVLLLAMIFAVGSAGIYSVAEAAEYTVKNNGSVTDGTSRVGSFSINGETVFCCDHNKSTPPTGTKATAQTMSNADIAKVLYYGYGGAGQWSGFKNKNAAIVATSLALDHYFNNGTGNGNPNYNAFMKFLSTRDASLSGTSYVLYKTGSASYQRLAAGIPNITVNVSVTKESAGKTFTAGNACYSLQGAQYGVYSDNKLLTVITTGEDGKGSASVNIKRNAAGKITVKEIKASQGYFLDKKAYACDGSSGKIAVNSKEPPAEKKVEALLYKYDSETDTASGSETMNYTSQKGAKLTGAVFKVNFYGIRHDELPSDNDFSDIKPLKTWYLESDENGRIKLEKEYLASGYEQSEFYISPDDGKTPVLPLGAITAEEVKAPEGYLLNDRLYVSEISSGSMSENIADSSDSEKVTYQIPLIPDNIKRADLKFSKVENGTNQIMAGIPFMITSLQEEGADSEKGESHVLVTDENGRASTASADHPHSVKTNANDAAWNGKTVDDAKLDAGAGIWFGESGAADDNRGALAYGRYRIDELPCEKNQGYKLLKNIEIKVDKDGNVIELGTLTNKRIELKTSVRDNKSNEDGAAMPGKDTILTDKVAYSGLEKGESYTLEGVLMDKKTGKELLVNGRKITSAKEFKAEDEDGEIDMEFTFDASELEGCSIVAFETLIKEGNVVVRHEDINDTDQTIEFLNPKIGTEASDGRTGNKYIESGKNAVIKDRIHYSGLMKGYTYEIKGVLMDKSSGRELLVNGESIAASIEFTPDNREGDVEVEFSFDASETAGRELVAFEELSWSGQIIAEHKDLNDEGQTVKVRNKSAAVVSTGDRIPAAMLPALALMTLSALAAVLVLYRKKLICSGNRTNTTADN